MNESGARLSTPNDYNESFVYLGHAMRRCGCCSPKPFAAATALFELVAERFRRHLEVSWDDVYGGFACRTCREHVPTRYCGAGRGYDRLFNLIGHTVGTGRRSGLSARLITWALSLRPHGFPLCQQR